MTPYQEFLALRRRNEARWGVESLDEMQDERRVKARELAKLKAKWGDKDYVSARRQAFRAAIKNERSAEPLYQDASEAKLDRLAEADPRYHRYLRLVASSKTRMLILEDEVREVTERIESRKSEIYAWGKEAGLQ